MPGNAGKRLPRFHRPERALCGRPWQALSCARVPFPTFEEDAVKRLAWFFAIALALAAAPAALPSAQRGEPHGDGHGRGYIPPRGPSRVRTPPQHAQERPNLRDA